MQQNAALRVSNWERNFETHESRKLKRLGWVAVPTDLGDIRYRMLIDHEDGPAHFGAWIAILEVASSCKVRGTLTDGGVALSAKHLAMKSGIPEVVFSAAIPRLLDLRWLEPVGSAGESAEVPGESAETAGESSAYITLHNRTEHKQNPHSVEWEIFKSLYPKNRFDENAALAQWEEQNDAAAIVQGLKAHIGCEEWTREDGRFTPRASKFIKDGLYRATPIAPNRVVSTMDPETRRRLDERRHIPAEERYKKWNGA